jgi:hypothetical protein
MWDWLTRRQSQTGQSTRVDVPIPTQDVPIPTRPTGSVSGKYKLLHTYLENRFADVVVLTFGQIEDILGCALPDPARTHLDWWTTGAAAEKPPCSDAWRLAGRTAVPNFPAKNVVFARTIGPPGRR